jgi:hypothetical protein
MHHHTLLICWDEGLMNIFAQAGLKLW